MKRLRQTFTLSLLATVTVFTTPAVAAIIVDTGAVPTMGGRPLNEAQGLFGFFTLDRAATVTSVEGLIGGDGATGTIGIFSDGNDPASSNLFYSASFTIIDSRLTSYQGVFGRNWALTPGNYWVGFSTDGTNSISGSATNPLSRHAIYSAIDNTYTQYGPELALGIRIIGDVAPDAVPEPATWAMMLTGFGAIGGAMRARRRVSVSYG